MNLQTKKKDIMKILEKYRLGDLKPKTVKKKLISKKNRKINACSKGFIKKLENLTRSEHITALSAPKPIRLQPWPNPLMERTLPIVIHESTLTGKIPPRIEYLSKPKQRKTINEIVEKSLKGSQNTTPVRRVSYSRIEKLAMPKPEFRKTHDGCMKSEQQGKVYFVSRMSKKNRTVDWVKHQQWLKNNSQPKKIPTKPNAFGFRKLSSNYIADMVNRLSMVPESKKFVKKPTIRTTEPRPAVHRIVPMDVDWVKRLSVPKELSPETLLNLNYDPYFIPKKVLTAKPSSRTVKLAEPKIKVKITEDTELKKNPYGVAPAALKYKTTKRIKKLAEPRKR